MSSTNINLSLQDYLNKSTSGSSNSLSSLTNNLKSSFNSWVGTSGDVKTPLFNDADGEESVNGWFAQASKDPCLPSLSKRQRVIGFFLFLLTGTLCFSIASLYIPFLVLKARKFALLYSLGSFFVLFSFSMLWGPLNHVKHLLQPSRLPFSLAYLSSLIATLYCALIVRSYMLTLFCALLQVLALVWYIVSYLPGGQKGLHFFSKVFYLAAHKTVTKTLPI